MKIEEISACYSRQVERLLLRFPFTIHTGGTDPVLILSMMNSIRVHIIPSFSPSPFPAPTHLSDNGLAMQGTGQVRSLIAIQLKPISVIRLVWRLV